MVISLGLAPSPNSKLGFGYLDLTTQGLSLGKWFSRYRTANAALVVINLCYGLTCIPGGPAGNGHEKGEPVKVSPCLSLPVDQPID
jgi:hypothetical protein